MLLSDGASPSDVGFYFVHWLTDLAGAEPSPLGGAEKFVLKFPHAVLDSFIRSFAVLNDLAIHTETKVIASDGSSHLLLMAPDCPRLPPIASAIPRRSR